MKKTLMISMVLLLMAAPASLFAWDSVYDQGDLSLSVTASFIFPLGIAVYPGLELILAQIDIAEEVPIDFGLAARAQVGLVTWSGNYGYTTFGGGAFGTAHLSFADMGSHSLEKKDPNFDFYISVGISFNYFTYTGIWFGDTASFRVGVATFEGVNWHLSDSFALKLEYVYWNYIGSSATIGVQLTL